MIANNLYLLIELDFLHISEYRQQIKTFQAKYVFLNTKIIRMAQNVVMKILKNNTSIRMCIQNANPKTMNLTSRCLLHCE